MAELTPPFCRRQKGGDEKINGAISAMLTHLKNQLKDLIEQSVRSLYPSRDSYPDVILDTPADKAHGELATNIALQLSRILRKNPLSIATDVQAFLENQIKSEPIKDLIQKIEVKKPGFINFFLAREAFYEILYEVFRTQDRYGCAQEIIKEKILIEFVSANPTGPLSVAHARQAAVGDVLGNILTFLGHDVEKEYYINDEGNQINLLGQSIEARAKEIFGELLQLPENGYQGEYIKDIAQDFIQEHKIKSLDDLQEKDASLFNAFGVSTLLSIIKKDLKDFGVDFDIWSSQAKIATTKNIENSLSVLRKKGHVFDQEGALWFKSTAFGDDKNRVVRKSDGNFTYLAPDIVYHDDKYKRGFTKLFNIWGPDHHGYIPRLKAAIQALGHPADSLVVLIVQLATIYKDGKPLSMSTRRGQYISLREVIDEVGVDAARYFFLMRHITAHLDFDLELAKSQTPENPIYYIQYAHARIHSIIKFNENPNIKPIHKGLKLLKEEEEIDLIRKIAFFADILDICEKQRDPFALTNYLLELATCFHKFYDCHRVIGEDVDLSSERLALIEAAKIVLANGLRLLGVSAPEKM
ncbi:MAG: arginine--tRNA ligase [Candidatus Omnitrophota bacterium]